MSGQDASTLRDLRLAALSDRPDAFGSTYDREVAFAEGVWRQRAAESSSGDGAATFIAWSGDTPIGLVGGFRADDGASQVVELVSMWTGPAARRSGVGRHLVEAVLAWARSTTADRVELWVTRGNDAAQRLYESIGFVVTGDHQPLPSDPCRDEVRMAMALVDDD